MLIGELAAKAGLSAKTIRFYEQAGLMPAPPRTHAGYRDYPPRALDRLAFIGHAQSAGCPPVTDSEVKTKPPESSVLIAQSLPCS